jgi:hypothetical protein
VAATRPHAWVSWAWILDKRGGDLERSEEVLRQGLAQHPKEFQLIARLAQNLSYQRRFDESEAICNELRERPPESPIPYQGLTYVAANLGGYDEAKALVEETLRRNPGPVTLEFLAASILYIHWEPTERSTSWRGRWRPARILLHTCSWPSS